MSLIPSHFLDPVVPIGVRAGGSEVRYTATGFVYAVSAGRSEDGHKLYVTFLITNRHVAEGSSELHVQLPFRRNFGLEPAARAVDDASRPGSRCRGDAVSRRRQGWQPREHAVVP